MNKWVPGLLVVALLWGVWCQPAHAADELMLSWDRETWSADLSGPVFDPSSRWVPGDDRTRGFWVRNTTSDPARLSVMVAVDDRDNLLADGDLALDLRVGRSDWSPLTPVPGGFRVDSRLAAEAESRVQVRARFDTAAPNRSQRDRLALDFRIRLTDAGNTPDDGGPDDDPPDEGGPDDPDDGGLPDTGAPAVGWLVLVAGAAIGTGMALMRRKDRKETGHGTPR